MFIVFYCCHKENDSLGLVQWLWKNIQSLAPYYDSGMLSLLSPIYPYYYHILPLVE